MDVMKVRHVALSALLLAVLGGSLLAQAVVTPSSFETQVAALAAAPDSAGRLAAITRRLDELGIRYQRLPFELDGRSGVNLLADVCAPGSPASPETSPRSILLGAHYDRVEVGQGAVDDASGVSTVLELVASLKANPLGRHRVQAVFFDLEEVGLFGSRAFVASPPEGRLPDLYLNFDIFAYGDIAWVMSKDRASPSAQAIIRAGEQLNFPVEVSADYPPGDDISFVGKGVQTLGIALIDRQEAKTILQMLKGQEVNPPPRLLTIMHTAADTPDKIDDEDVSRAIPVIERAIRLFDAHGQ